MNRRVAIHDPASRWWGLRRCAPADTAAKIPFILPIHSGARLAGVPVMYVVVRFRPGYPEVSDRNALFRGLKAAGRLGEGAPGAEIHAQVAPQPTEVIVTKRRVGPPRPEA